MCEMSSGEQLTEQILQQSETKAKIKGSSVFFLPSSLSMTPNQLQFIPCPFSAINCLSLPRMVLGNNMVFLTLLRNVINTARSPIFNSFQKAFFPPAGFFLPGTGRGRNSEGVWIHFRREGSLVTPATHSLFSVLLFPVALFDVA